MINKPSTEDKKKLKSINEDIQDFTNFELTTLDFNCMQYSPYFIISALLKRISMKNNISERYVLFLKFHSLLLKSNLMNRIKYLKSNRKNIDEFEYQVMVCELQKDVFSLIKESLNQMDKNNAHKNQPFYYEKLVR